MLKADAWYVIFLNKNHADYAYHDRKKKQLIFTKQDKNIKNKEADGDPIPSLCFLHETVSLL